MQVGDWMGALTEFVIMGLLVVGLVTAILFVLFALLLFIQVRKLVRSLTEAVDNWGKVSQSAVDPIVKPLEEGVSFSSALGGAAGFVTGFLGGIGKDRKRGRKK